MSRRVALKQYGSRIYRRHVQLFSTENYYRNEPFLLHIQFPGYDSKRDSSSDFNSHGGGITQDSPSIIANLVVKAVFPDEAGCWCINKSTATIVMNPSPSIFRHAHERDTS